jgi:hypothetical protein
MAGRWFSGAIPPTSLRPPEGGYQGMSGLASGELG